MIHRPRIIFADEPTGLLDRRTGMQVMSLLRGYRDQGSLIAVTHNPEILSEADLVVTLRDGQIARIENRLARAAQNNSLYQGNEYLDGLVMLVPIVIIATTAFALVIVIVNWIALSRRLPELGISHALGHSKKWLIRRLTMETATLASVGWAMGIGLSWLVLYILKVTLFVPQGHDLPIIQLSALGLVPLPMAVSGFTFIGVRRILSRLDPVAIVERGAQSQEGDQKRGLTASKSSPKPLASATFYKRHRRRAVLLVSAMSLMIMAVVLAIFTLAVSFDAQEPGLGYLSQLSIVRSSGVGEGLDPGK